MADYSLVKGSSTVLSTGDVAYINGFAGEFKVKAKNGIITLTSKSDKTVFYTVSATSGAKLAFLDGAATVANSKVSLAVKGLDSAVNSKETFSFVAPAAFTLTTGIDEWTGTSGNQTVRATLADGTLGLTSLDTIDGGAGTDTLVFVATGALDTTAAAIAGESISGFENVSMKSALGVTANTTDWAGTTSLSITSADDVAATAAATTDVTVKASALSAAAGTELAVDGGKTVTVTSADSVTLDLAGAAVVSSDIVVGGTTAAAGAVKVTHTETVSNAAGAAAASVGTTSTVTVTGGTSVEVNSLVTAGAGDHLGDIATVGAIAVNGNANTTSVTVKQSAATAAWAAAGDKIKITNGTVTIADTNAATASDTLTTVTLENFGNSTIASNVLSTVNLKGGSAAGTASGTLGLNVTNADTSTVATTLNLNLAGGFVGAISGTQAAKYTTVNVASSAASTVADVSFAAAKTLNVSGAGVTTISALTDIGAVTAINSTGAGLTLGAAIGTGVAVTGGDGVETISVGATTKAINLGGGNDVLTISATPGAGGSFNGGAGTGDVIVAATNGSSLIADPSITGFEILRVDGGQGAHVATGFTGLQVGAIAANASFTQVAAGVGLTQRASFSNARDLTVTLANATGTTDSFSLTLSSAGAIGAAGETITLAGVETVNITSTDTDTTAHQNTVELVASSAKTVNVSGNAGLIVVNADASITTFDASGVALAKVTDNGVTFDSTNTTVGELVTIKGSNGIDSLTGSATAADTIYGNAGADTITYDGGADVFYGGAGNDKFVISAGTALVQATIADLTAGDTIDLAGATLTAAGAQTLGAKVTLGANATFAQYLDAAAATAIVDAAAGGGTGVSIVKWFQLAGNTYVVVDTDAADDGNADTVTFGAEDTVVKITGLVDLTNSTLSAADLLTVV